MVNKWISNFKLVKQIGRGQFGKVYLGYDNDLQEQVAIKVIKLRDKKGKIILSNHQVKLLQNQISILMSIQSPYTVKFIDVKKTKENVYIILEYCNGDTLANYIKNKKHISQQQATIFLRQLLQAFRVLNKFRIIHRDLKPANILLHNGKVKVADFGFSRTLGTQEMATTSLGSPLHMAPQILKGNAYTSKVDIWSLGTIFYQLLFGKTPYIASNIVDLYKNIKKGELLIPLGQNPISAQTQQLLQRMLVFDQEKRISWQQLFEYKFERLQITPSQKNQYDQICEGLIHNTMGIDFMCPAGVKGSLCQFPSMYLFKTMMKKCQNKDYTKYISKLI